MCLKNKCMDIKEFKAMAFVLHFPIVISCLMEPQIVVHEDTKLDFFYSSWNYLICFLLCTKYFTSKISNSLLHLESEGRRQWTLIYPVNISLIFFLRIYLSIFIYLFFSCCYFTTFCCFKGLNQRFAKAVIL